MSPESPPSDLSVTVLVKMAAPSFIPGATVSATITLQAHNRTPLSTSRSASLPTTSRPSLSYSTSAATSALASFSPSATARASYVVAEFSGRWTTDRAWVVPHAHPRVDASIHLDNHAHAPVASTPSNVAHHAPPDPTLGPYPWSAALADANAVGGGGRPGHTGVIFRSHPLVVCEREQIPTGSAVTFGISCVLPDALPPTLRGSAVRYSYALVIVAHFPDAHAPRVVRVPFRILPPITTFRPDRPLPASPSGAASRIAVPTPRDVGPRPNRFLQDAQATALSMAATLLKSAPPDDIEIALALSLNGRLTGYKTDVTQRGSEGNPHDGGLLFLRGDADVHATPNEELELVAPATAAKRRVARVYSITRGRDSIAKIYLPKRIHHLGENVTAMFSFQGTERCYRIGARLEAQEIVHAEHAVGLKGGMMPSDVDGMGMADMGAGAKNVVFRKVFGEHGEFVMANRNSHITFSIPHDAPASFSTNVVSIRWLIHFVFVAPKTKKPTSAFNSVDSNGRDSSGGELKEMAENGTAEGEEAARLIEEIAVQENGDVDHDDGWLGGAWAGENPRNWTHLPTEEVDVLRWTLPIVVSGKPGSQWGSRSVGKILHPPQTT